MPDNKNPPKNDQPQKPGDEEEKISRVGATIKCKDKDCKLPALSLSPFCWKHTEDKEEFRKRIEQWGQAGKSMKRFILTGANLSGLWLWGAKLSKAILNETNLSEAELKRADLSGAELNKASLFKAYLKGSNLSYASLERARLSGAELKITNLSGAKLGRADLSDAGLIGANLSGADLRGADLSGAWLERADLTNALLHWANLTDARGLTKENFSEKPTEEERKETWAFKMSYLTVKKYFSLSGQYDDVSWVAFRERTLERVALANELKKELWIIAWLIPAWWKTVFRWFGSKVMSLLNGYGERPLRVVLSSGVIVILFSIIYYIFKCIQAYPIEKLHFWDYLYFSIVTFTTLGYGDIRPLAVPWARMVASMEAFIGAFMIALFVLTLARRYVAR